MLPSALVVSTPVAPDSASTPPMLGLPRWASACVESVNSKMSDLVGPLVPGAPSRGSLPDFRNDW